ncbi:MAG: hypothetical protein Fur0022_11990 [Anaerolineales bacterium]
MWFRLSILTIFMIPILVSYSDTSTDFDCSTVVDVPTSECEALVSFYNSTFPIRMWNGSANWLITNTVCNWYGITCTNGHVTEINLHSNNIEGFIPPEIGNLTELISLDLGATGYTANLLYNIPIEIGNLTKLEILNMTGGIYRWAYPTLPVEIENLVNLQTLELGNGNLAGQIPDLSNMTQLEYLNLYDNRLTGSIPEALGNLFLLKFIAVGKNNLAGSLPISLTNLSQLYNFNWQPNLLLCEPSASDFQEWLEVFRGTQTKVICDGTRFLPFMVKEQKFLNTP